MGSLAWTTPFLANCCPHHLPLAKTSADSWASPLLLYPQFTCPGPSAADRTGRMLWEDPVGDPSNKPFQRFHYFKDSFCAHPPGRRAWGSQGCWPSPAPHGEKWLRNCHIPSTQVCPPSLTHRSSSCPPSPPRPLFGTDLKPPWVTQWARRLRLGFVKMKPF